MAERDSNPEMAAIGLDTSNWVGLSTDEIRGRLGSEHLALMLPDEPIPKGWPREILRIDESKDLLTWYYLHPNGEWLSDKEYLWSGYKAARTMPAFVYARRPLASPLALVHPVVQLLIIVRDENRVCMSCRSSYGPTDYPAGPSGP